MRPSGIWTAALGAGALLVASAPARATPSAEEACGDCHEEHVVSMGLGPHSVLERGGRGFEATAEVACVSCHGDATAHVEDGASTMMSFADAAPAAANETCLECHGDSHPRFAASPHAQAGIACVSCHSVHGADPPGPPLLSAPGVEARLADVGGASAMCYSCHEAAFVDFEFNERHRLHEGILDCMSCHDPHDRSSRAILGGFKQQACVQCHTDKEGPFVFEHGSVRAEGCTACHTAHGSPNRHMLAFQDTAALCYSCHSEVPGFHIGFGGPVRFNLTTQCTNCHSAIHGSNLHPAFLQ